MAKKYRKGSIAYKANAICDKVDTEPFATVTFMGVMAAVIGTFCWIINTVYPLV